MRAKIGGRIRFFTKVSASGRVGMLVADTLFRMGDGHANS